MNESGCKNVPDYDLRELPAIVAVSAGCASFSQMGERQSLAIGVVVLGTGVGRLGLKYKSGRSKICCVYRVKTFIRI